MSGEKKLNVFLSEAAEDSSPWFKTLDEPTRQKVFAYMRKLGNDETKLRENARKYSTPHGSVALGGADFEYNLKAECISTYLRVIRNGKTPVEALSITRLERTSLVKSFNASISDYHIQRELDAEETLIQNIHRGMSTIIAAHATPDAPIIPKTEKAGKTKIEWKQEYGDTTSTHRKIRGIVPGFNLIVLRTFGKNYNSFAIVETDDTGRVTSAAIEEKKGFRTFAEAKKAGIAALSKHFAMKNPGATPKAPKPILKGDRTSLNIKAQTFNGVKMTPKQYKTFKAQAQSMDVPVIVAAHNGAIVQMNHEPDGAVDYAIIYPLGRFVPSHAHADPRTGFLPSHADEYHQRSVGQDQHAKPVESHGAPKPDNVPGMILRKDEPLTNWLNQKFDSQMHNPAVHGLQSAVYDAARRLYHYSDKFGIKPVFITDQFNLVSATSAKEVFLTQKQKIGNPASQASKGLMWCVTFDPTPFVFTVYEYIPKEHLEPLELLKELGLGYMPDQARLAHPMLTDLITQEPLGRMTIAQAAEFAKHYVHRPRMDNKSFSFTPLQWKTLYSAVAHAQSQDKNRHNLVGIMLRPGRRGKDEIEAVAVNGAVLSIAHIQGNPLPHSIFIPTPAVKLMNAAYRAKQVPSLIFRNEELHQKSDSLNFGGTLTVDVAGERTPFVVSISFPDYERVAARKDGGISVSFDTKKLIEALKSLIKTERHEYKVAGKWTFDNLTNECTLLNRYYSDKTNEWVERTSIIPFKPFRWNYRNTGFEIGFNTIYALNILKSMSTKTVTFISDGHPGAPVLFTDTVHGYDAKHEHTLMPMRV